MVPRFPTWLTDSPAGPPPARAATVLNQSVAARLIQKRHRQEETPRSNIQRTYCFLNRIGPLVRAGPKGARSFGCAWDRQVLAEDEMRVCKICQQSLALESFQAEPRVKDGRRSVCRLCTKAARAGKHTGKQARSKSPEKNRARGRVRDAVRYGKIIKPMHCQLCSAETPAHLLDGHHADYSRPLDVIWLCRSCHGAEALKLE